MERMNLTAERKERERESEREKKRENHDEGSIMQGRRVW